MISPETRLAALGTACLLLAAGGSGCGSEPESRVIPAAAPSRPAPPPTPAPPPVTPVDQLMAELGIDDRVNLPEHLAPGSTEARKAVLVFFDSFARGDATALSSMLSVVDRDELDALVESGAWAKTTARIERIDVQTGTSPAGDDCALAIFYVGDGFQPQLWYYTTEGPTFDAVAAPPNMMDRLSGDDWITAWFQILEEELALADVPDEEIIIPQRDMSDASRTGSYSGPSTSPTSPSSPAPGRPTAPPGTPGKRPSKPKRAPPGKGR